MTAEQRPTIAAIDALDPDACVSALAPLFEGAPRFLQRLCDARPLGSAHALFERAREIAHAMPEEEQVELIDAHPRLGAPPASLSPLSYREQGYNPEAAEAADAAEVAEAADAAAPAEELTALNEEYERRFGFRYCTFVAGRPRAALVPELRERLAADRDAELHRALDDVVRIAAHRYASLAGTGA